MSSLAPLHLLAMIYPIMAFSPFKRTVSLI
jgi:hypothetical protein